MKILTICIISKEILAKIKKDKFFKQNKIKKITEYRSDKKTIFEKELLCAVIEDVSTTTDTFLCKYCFYSVVFNFKDIVRKIEKTTDIRVKIKNLEIKLSYKRVNASVTITGDEVFEVAENLFCDKGFEYTKMSCQTDNMKFTIQKNGTILFDNANQKDIRRIALRLIR